MGLKSLILKCQQHDKKAQEKLYRQYSGKLFSLCLKYCENYEQAEDNLHDGFLKIFSNIAQFRGKGSFEGWMTRIMINTALKKYQKRTFLVPIEEDEIEEPEIELGGQPIPIDYLIEIIQELPDAYRLVFNLYAMDGFTHKEIAEMLQISEGTSKSNLARARKKLKQKIEEKKLLLSRHSL